MIGQQRRLPVAGLRGDDAQSRPGMPLQPIQESRPFERRRPDRGRTELAVDDSRCEFAIVIGDEWQGCGLARQMMQHLIDHARQGGLHLMSGYVHPQNRRMLNFVRAIGFESGESREEPSLKLVTLQLQPARDPE